VARVVLLANFPGDPGDFLFILINEWNSSRADHLEAENLSYQKIFGAQIAKKKSGQPIESNKGEEMNEMR
jgi:hypothetical protein